MSRHISTGVKIIMRVCSYTKRRDVRCCKAWCGVPVSRGMVRALSCTIWELGAKKITQIRGQKLNIREALQTTIFCHVHEDIALSHLLKKYRDQSFLPDITKNPFPLTIHFNCVKKALTPASVCGCAPINENPFFLNHPSTSSTV